MWCFQKSVLDAHTPNATDCQAKMKRIIKKFVELNDDMDPNRNRSDTAMKRRKKEHLVIASYLQILKFEEEVPGRKNARKDFIDALQRVEIRLDGEDEDAWARCRMEEARSENEGIMVSIIDELFESVERINENMNKL